MNTNTGNDPMLSGFTCEDWTKLSLGAAYPSPLPLPPLSQASGAFTIPVEGLLSPEPSSAFTDLASLWAGSERKRVSSVHMEHDDDNYEDDDGDDDDDEEGIVQSADSCSSPPGEMDIDVGSNSTVDVKSELSDDSEFTDENLSAVNSVESFEPISPAVPAGNALQLTEKEARKLVEEQFERIAFLPGADLSQREKINFILAQSDCNEFSVDDVLNFDKRKSESARACANIVQNIPQRYRWECVRPEDIPCCYTIVADCKKVCSRDKPPRPMNAFMIWAQGARRLINVLCPKMQNALISEALGYYWRLKSDAFKQRFEEEKIKLRGFHNVEFPAYKYKPKTKVQKAKEKQELSLSKAKLRASLKREKAMQLKASQPQEASNLYKRRVGAKCGRPRKPKPTTPSAAATKTGSKVSTSSSVTTLKVPKTCRRSSHETVVQTSPTKPEIKDMLTLKILNDRRFKESGGNRVAGMTGATPGQRNVTPTRDSVQSMFGQLSPLEVDQPAMGDILEELEDFESLLGESYTSQPGRDRFQTSSVFDTPANTPPAEEDSQLQQHQLSPAHMYIKPEPTSSPPNLPPLSNTTAAVVPTSFYSTPSSFSSLSQPLKVSLSSRPAFPSNPCSNPISTVPSPSPSCSSRTQILMPSLSAMLASPAKTSPFSSGNLQNIPASCSNSGATHFTLATAKPVGPASKNQPRFTNILSLQFVGKDIVTSKLQSKTSSKVNTQKSASLLYPANGKTNFTTVPVINRIVCGKAVDGKRAVLAESVDSNNNNNSNLTLLGAPPSYATSVMNLKVVGAVTDTYDLDSLSLDPNVPLLSEDVMRSYIDSL